MLPGGLTRSRLGQVGALPEDAEDFGNEQPRAGGASFYPPAPEVEGEFLSDRNSRAVE